MKVTKEDIFEALGLSERGVGNFWGPGLVGLCIGALLGSSLALLLAPRTGSELREELIGRGRRLVERGRAQVAETAEDVARHTEPRNY